MHLFVVSHYIFQLLLPFFKGKLSFACSMGMIHLVLNVCMGSEVSDAKTVFSYIFAADERLKEENSQARWLCHESSLDP